MPKREEKKVLLNAICTCPPSARAEIGLSQAAAIGTQHHRIADAQGGVHDLIFGAGRDHAGLGGLGAVAEAHQHLHLGTERATVEFDRLLAFSVKEQVGLNQHIPLLPRV